MSVFGRETFPNPDVCNIYGWQMTILWVSCLLLVSN